MPIQKVLLSITILAGTLMSFTVGKAFAADIPQRKPDSEIALKELIRGADRTPAITALAVGTDSRFLAVAGDDHLVRYIDVREKPAKVLWQQNAHRDWVRGAAFSPDGTKLVSVDQSGEIRIWDVAGGRSLAQARQPVRGAQRVVVSPDGTQFAVCGYAPAVRVYSLADARELTVFDAPGGGNRALAYSPDGKRLAVAGRDGTVRIWNLADRRIERDIPGDGRRINALAFSPNGQLLAGGGDGPSLLLWNCADGKPAAQCAERPGKTFSLLFCGDDRLVSGESDNVIRLWNVADGTQMLDMTGHTGTVAALAYDAANNTLISGSFDTTVKYWTLPE